MAWPNLPLVPWIDVFILSLFLLHAFLLIGLDTEKETKEPYRPGFMQHFDRKEEGKRGGVKKLAPVGPQSVYAYFPSIPDGMDFKDYVSLYCSHFS